MRPPICDLCDSRFDPTDGALVRFESTPADLEWRTRADDDGIVGHPPDSLWFCPEHVARARTLAGLAAADALELMRSDLAVRPAERHIDRPVVEIDCPAVSHDRLYVALVDTIRPAGAAMGIGVPDALDRESWTDWTPMDRVLPPNCPYVAHRRTGFEQDGHRIHASMDASHWNDTDIGTAGASLTIGIDGVDGTYDQNTGGFFFSVSGRWSAKRGEVGMIRVLWVNTPLDPRLTPVLEDLVRRLEG